jgi:hypothetical protein
MLLIPIFLSASITSQAVADPSANRFIESLIASEIVLRLDRRDVKDTKNSPAAVKVLMTDVAAIRTSIQTYQDTYLASLPDDAPKSLQLFRTELQAFKDSLNPEKILAAVPSGKSCCDHDSAYLKLMISAMRAPGFSLENLSTAARYNLSPVLVEKRHGLIYADPSSSNEARILPRIVRKGSLLRKGDVIVAVRADDEKAWVPVQSWGDVLRASNNFFTGEAKVFVRVKRNKTYKDLIFASSPVVVNTE